MFDHDPYHASYTRVDVGQPRSASSDPDASTVVFYDRQREVAIEVGQPEPPWRTGATYVRLGVAHILTGADHLTFLAALLLAAALRGRQPARAATAGESIRSAAAIVSAFTVAHSLTLATQVLRPGMLPTGWVEPAIALSVAVVALENLLPRPPRARWALVFAFGLVHGLGFASALREIGLPRRGLVLALVSFNVGVELGQLLIVGLALPLLVAAARRNARPLRAMGTARRLGRRGRHRDGCVFHAAAALTPRARYQGRTCPFACQKVPVVSSVSASSRSTSCLAAWSGSTVPLPSVMSVRTKPGCRIATAMPEPRRSRASDTPAAFSAALDMRYP